MLIYNYSAITGELTYVSEADKNPLEEGNFLIPAYATIQIPKEPKENIIPVFNGKEWEYKSDYRNKVFYNKITKEKYIITSIGEVPTDAFTLLVPFEYSVWSNEKDCWIFDLEAYKFDANQINKSKHIQYQNIPFVVKVEKEDGIELNLTLNCTDDTCFNIDRAMSVADKLGSCVFCDGFGVGNDMKFTVKDMLQIFVVVNDKLQPSFTIKGNTKLLINNATSKEEIDKIVEDIKY